MARIRSIKPEFFKHYGLYRAEVEEKLPLRLAFAGLWGVADREGRFNWRPEELKLDCLPYDKINFARVMDALEASGFIVKYTVNGVTYGFIPKFHVHQRPNRHEAKSRIPPPDEADPSEMHVHARACTKMDGGNDRGEMIDDRGEMIEGKECAPKGARRSHFVPPDFQVSESMMRWATETRPDLDVKLETEKFMDYEFKTPKSDWGRAWRSWIRNSRGATGMNGDKKPKPDILDKLLEKAEKEEADAERRRGEVHEKPRRGVPAVEVA